MLATTDTFKKMFAFEAKRFVAGKLDGMGVFLAEDGHGTVEVDTVWIKEKFLFVRGDVIENGHLFVTNDNEALLLKGMQPTHEKMGPALIGETEARDGDVGEVGPRRVTVAFMALALNICQ